MAAEEGEVARSEGPRGDDELLPLEGQDARPRQPREDGHGGDPDRHHADEQARAEHGRDEQGREDGREAVDGVHEPHDGLVHFLAGLAQLRRNESQAQRGVDVFFRLLRDDASLLAQAVRAERHTFLLRERAKRVDVRVRAGRQQERNAIALA